MSVTRAALLSLVVLSGCLTSAPPGQPGCQSNEECQEGQLCFAEGCGDPGKGIVVEVTGGSLSSQTVQDFQIPDGELSKAQDFSLSASPGINGEFLRERTATPNPQDRSVYTSAVVLRATGRSTLLPGISRVFESRFERPERGFYEMRLASGEYTLTATASDRSVPPVTVENVLPATPLTAVSFAFPAADGAPALTGQIIKTTDATLVPPEPVRLSASYPAGAVPVIDVQLIDVATNQPLSQRFPLNSAGEFALTVSPEARNRSTLILEASPREVGAAVPTKRFTLTAPLPPAVSLEYGDFGEPGTVVGSVVDSTGAPVAEAQVLLAGIVKGEGTYRSKIAVTDAEGRFSLTTLPSRGEGTFTLHVVPPRMSRAAAARLAATVTVANGNATLSPAVARLGDRLIARGRVLRAGTDVGAGGVVVRATVQNGQTGTVETAALPFEPAETITDQDGRFELPIDEGLWRFEYFPGAQAPLASRLVNIQADRDENGTMASEVVLRDVPLSFGRTVTGVVTAVVGDRTGQPASYAQLRFFRVTWVEGKEVSILLGTAIADERGAYRVVLPAVSTGAQ